MNIKKLLITALLSITVIANFTACSSTNTTPNRTDNSSVDEKTNNLKEDIKQEATDMKDNVTDSIDNMTGNSSANTDNK